MFCTPLKRFTHSLAYRHDNIRLLSCNLSTRNRKTTTGCWYIVETMKELIRPWKLFTLAVGMTWLLWGALTLNIPDWDVGVSVLMGGLAYLTAPWSVRVLLLRRYRWWPLAAYWYWMTVDGSYMAYHGLAGNETFRLANFIASTTLYWLCGFIWLHRGPLKTLITERRALL
jgi:hypothetical protein